MRWQDRFRQARAEWMLLTLYERFEQVVIRFLNERPVWGAASNTISGRDGRKADLPEHPQCCRRYAAVTWLAQK